jgi:hypothetical protein
MKDVLTKFGAVLIVCLVHQVAFAVEPQDIVFDPILHELRVSVDSDDFQQIADAIASSETLQRELNELVAANRFSGFLVSPRARVTDDRAEIFGGFTQGSKIVLTTEFLKELRKARLFDVVYPDDILPNNTVFVLAHLLYHIRNPLDPRKYSSKDAFVEAAIKIEAAAFIQAWNTMLQVAERNNDGKPLSPRQVGQLLMNVRYRFALIGAMTQKSDPLKFLQSGFVELNDINVQAVAATLKNSRHADLE